MCAETLVSLFTISISLSLGIGAKKMGEVDKIRVADRCMPTSTWYESEGNNTIWHGMSIWMLAMIKGRNLPPYQVIHDLPQPNYTAGIYYSGRGLYC